MFLYVFAVSVAIPQVFDPARLARDLPAVNDALARDVEELTVDVLARLYKTGVRLRVAPMPPTVPAAPAREASGSRAELLAAARDALARGGDGLAQAETMRRVLQEYQETRARGEPWVPRDLTRRPTPGVKPRGDWPPAVRDLARENAELLDLRARLREAVGETAKK